MPTIKDNLMDAMDRLLSGYGKGKPQLNIHFGNAEPINRTMLWCKCGEPKKIEITDYSPKTKLNEIVSGEGFIPNSVYEQYNSFVHKGYLYQVPQAVASHRLQLDRWNLATGIKETNPKSQNKSTGKATSIAHVSLINGEYRVYYDDDAFIYSHIIYPDNFGIEEKSLFSSRYNLGGLNSTGQTYEKFSNWNHNINATTVHCMVENNEFYILKENKHLINKRVGTSSTFVYLSENIFQTTRLNYATFYNGNYYSLVWASVTELKLYRINRETGLVTELCSINEGIYYDAAVPILSKNGFIYRFGGKISSSSSAKSDDIYKFDLLAGTVEKLEAKLPSPYGGHTAPTVYIENYGVIVDENTVFIPRFDLVGRLSFDLETDKLLLTKENYGDWKMINLDGISVTAKPKQVLIGDVDGKAQIVKSYLYKEEEEAWVNVIDGTKEELDNPIEEEE